MMNIKSHIRFAFATIVLCACIVFVYKHILITSDKTRTSTKEFSSHILNWVGDEVSYDKDVLSQLSPDKIVYKTYRNNKRLSLPITLFMAYYDTLEKADLSHSPIVCFTGQGWKIEDTTKAEIPLNLPDIEIIKVNQIIQKRLDTTMIVLFWYQSANHTFSNRSIQKVSLFFDKLLGKSDNNAFVRVTIHVPKGKSIEDTTSHLFAFIRDLYPELRRFFL